MTHGAAQKQASKIDSSKSPEPSAGPHGIALAPPDYGIDFVDCASAGDGPIQRQAAAGGESPRLAVVPRPNNTGLPDNLKSGIESLSGFSLAHVNVHYNSSQPAELNALAYAQGTDIHVAPGGNDICRTKRGTSSSRRGAGEADAAGKGCGVNDDQGLEREADIMGGRRWETPSARGRWRAGGPNRPDRFTRQIPLTLPLISGTGE